MLLVKDSIKYFILGCIPMRLLIIYLIYLVLNNSKKYENERFFLSVLILLIGFSFIYLYFTNSRLNAFEAGGKTYWAPYRIIHGILYIIGGLMLYNKNMNAYIPLIIDLIIGILIFLKYRLV